MLDGRDQTIGPVAPVTTAPAVHPVRAEPPVQTPGTRADIGPVKRDQVASTGGGLPAAYSQFVVDEQTHDVVIRIRDAATDQVLAQYPSQEVENIAAYMKAYAETLARHRAAHLKPLPH